MKSQWLYVYDNECPVCSKAANLLHKLDKNGVLQFVDAKNIQTYSSDIKDILSKHELELLEDVGLISPNGEVYIGADAMGKIIELLPASRPLAWMFRRTFVGKVIVPVYSLMKSVRRACGACPEN